MTITRPGVLSPGQSIVTRTQAKPEHAPLGVDSIDYARMRDFPRSSAKRLLLRFRHFACWMAVSSIAVCRPVAGELRDLIPKPATQYILAAFDRYPLVALSEWHGARETMEAIRNLIHHPRFAGNVTDVVVEFGNARYQSLMDRYIRGEEVSRSELKQVWENTTQISDIWSSPIYERFFADVRALNRTVPVNKRVRVLLGDPPIDWTKVTSPADEDMNDWRDAHFAWVVEKQVMDKKRKALLFVGGAHISRKVILPNSLIHILDRKFPGRTLVVSAVQVPLVKPELARLFGTWPVPSVAEIRRTTLGAVDVYDVGFRLSRGRLQDDIDVVVFLGTNAFSNVSPQTKPQSAFGVELKRRQELQEHTIAFRGGRIRFAHESTALVGSAEAALHSVVAEMLRDRALVLLVKAYSDATELNAVQLSRDRAQFLVEWLVRHGAERRRLTPVGCGTTRPVRESDSEQHRAANRRAELVRHTKSARCQPPDSFKDL